MALSILVQKDDNVIPVMTFITSEENIKSVLKAEYPIRTLFSVMKTIFRNPEVFAREKRELEYQLHVYIEDGYSIKLVME